MMNVQALWKDFCLQSGQNSKVTKPDDLAAFFLFLQNNGNDWGALLEDSAFLSIKDQNSILHYGGNQAWFTDHFLRLAGCGTVAAADITAYVARRNSWQSLYGGDLFSKTIPLMEFQTHMHAVVDKLKPTSKGIPDVGYFQNGFESFLNTKGFEGKVWYEQRGSNKSPDQIKAAGLFILFNLLQDRPIACIHWFGASHLKVYNPEECGESIANMNWHWVVITELYCVNKELFVGISSEGKRYRFALKNFLGEKPCMITPQIEIKA